MALTLVAPIMLLAPWDGLYYLGYIGLVNYHNPTIQLLKPLALVCIILATRDFSSGRSSWKIILVAAFLTILSALIKPNFLLAFLPALGLLAILYALSKQAVDWYLVFFGFMVPGGISLLVQYGIAYFWLNGDNTSIIFDPFGVMSGFSQFLLLKFTLSILFPLIVLLFHFREFFRDRFLPAVLAGVSRQPDPDLLTG